MSATDPWAAPKSQIHRPPTPTIEMPDPDEIGLEERRISDVLPDALRESALVRAWLERVAAGRDLRIIISADNAATGVGKTTLAVYLAMLYDAWSWESVKCTLDPREFSVFYDKARPLSCLILDEAEQALERRRSMSNDVLEVGHDFATKRYRQLMGILTLPSKDMMDARIADKLCDYWVLVREKGVADVFRFDENQFSGQVYYHKVETFEWPSLDGIPQYDRAERMKREYEEGQTQSRYVRREELEAVKDNYWEKASAKTRFDLVRSIYEVGQDENTSAKITQSQIGQACGGLAQNTISTMVRADSFEDYYKSYAEDSR